MIMKHILFTTKALLLALCIGWGLLATSCINEDLDGCYTLTLKAVNINGEDITESGDVTDAALYIYDENGKYLETVNMTVNQIVNRTPVQINYPASAKLTIVAWGNTVGSEQKVVAGSTINDLTMELATKTSAVMEHPRDLFFGDDDIPLKAGVLTRNEEVVISLKVARIEMRTENLAKGIEKWREQQGLRADEDVSFDFYFKESLNKVDYSGNVEGEKLSHNPYAELTTGYEWETPEFENVLPGELQKGTFNINGTEYAVESKDRNTGEEIKLVEGQEGLIIFQWGDDGAFLGITVKVRPWGYVEDNIEW